MIWFVRQKACHQVALWRLGYIQGAPHGTCGKSALTRVVLYTYSIHLLECLSLIPMITTKLANLKRHLNQSESIYRKPRITLEFSLTRYRRT